MMFSLPFKKMISFRRENYMNNLIALINRHRIIFLRDYFSVFFSLLSVLITIILYLLFLKKMQVDYLTDVAFNKDTISLLVDEWFVAGILSIIPVTTTLAQYHMPIHDTEQKVTADFLTTPISRTTLQLSYIINAIIMGFIFSITAFFLCELLILFNGGTLLTFTEAIYAILLLFLAVALSSTINSFFMLFLETQNSFSIVSSIVGTFIGFLCAVYIPIGMLPNFVQYIIMYFPISHITLLLREHFMADSLERVFAQAPSSVVEDYELMFGVTYKMHGHILTLSISYLFIIGSMIVLLFVFIGIYKRKYR